MVAFAWVCWSFLLIMLALEAFVIIAVTILKREININVFRLACDIMPFVFLCIYLFG